MVLNQAALDFLDALVRRYDSRKPLRILSVGTGTGRNDVRLVQRAVRVGGCLKVVYFGFDLFEKATPELLSRDCLRPVRPPQRADVLNFFRRRCREMTVSVATELFAGDSRVELPALLSQLPPIHLAVVDGGHSLETITSDLRCALQLLAEGGQILVGNAYADRRDVGARSVLEKLEAAGVVDMEVLQDRIGQGREGGWLLSLRPGRTSIADWEKRTEPLGVANDGHRD